MAGSEGIGADARMGGDLVRARLPLVRALQRRGVPAQEAEDLAHDATLAAWKARDRFDPGRPLLPWLLTIAWRRLLDRRRGSRPLSVSRPERETSDLPEDALLLAEERRLLHRALACLSGPERKVIRLRYEEHRAVAEIARLLDLPAGTVKSHLHRAREALARILKEDRKP